MYTYSNQQIELCRSAMIGNLACTYPKTLHVHCRYTDINLQTTIVGMYVFPWFYLKNHNEMVLGLENSFKGLNWYLISCDVTSKALLKSLDIEYVHTYIHISKNGHLGTRYINYRVGNSWCGWLSVAEIFDAQIFRVCVEVSAWTLWLYVCS